MYKSELGVVVVVNEDKAVGIITERDVVSIINSDIDMSVSVKSFFKFYFLITINETRNVGHALHMFVDNSVRRLVVVDDDDKFSGIITQDYVLKHLDKDAFKTNLKIMNFIDKNIKIISLNQRESVSEAFSVMHEMDIGSIIAVDDDDNPVGVLSERDSIVILHSQKVANVSISSVMSSPVITVYEDAYVNDVVKIMDENRIRRVLIVERNTKLPISILTTRDISHNIKGNYRNILESKLKSIKNALNNMGEPILEIYRDEDEKIIQWMNDSAINIFGNTLGRNLEELIDVGIVNDIYLEAKLNGKFSKHKVEIDKRYYELIYSHYVVGLNEVLLIILRDVSSYENAIMSAEEINQSLEVRVQEEIAKNKQQEMLMFQQSRLAQMGEMISMIAHQWRQPLNNLSILTQMIYFKYIRKKLDDKLMDRFNEDSKKQIQQMSRTIDDFRDFFKPDNEKINFYVGKSIRDTLELLKPIFDTDNIEVSCEINEDIEFIGYPNEFNQSLINIINNAKDALIDKKIKNKKIFIELNREEEKITLRIKDNAGGIPKEIMDKIYDPYFSTKCEKNGTGLGLYMTKLIIEEHMKGSIRVRNDDEGAVFEITFEAS